MSIKTYPRALFDKKNKAKIFCSIDSTKGDVVSFQSHAFSKFIEAGAMAPSEILGLFMAIMYNWDVTDSKESPGGRESNTYEKSFFLGVPVLQKYCVPYGTIKGPCGYRVVFNKHRIGEGKTECSVFSVKKLGSRYLTTATVHNNRECYLHAGIPDYAAIERKEAEAAEKRKRKREEESSEIRDLRQEVDRLRKKNRSEVGAGYHYAPAPAGLMPPPESVPYGSYGSYVYYAPQHGIMPPPGVMPPPNYPPPETPSS